MNKSEMDKLRSSTLYDGEVLRVRYVGKHDFPKDIIEVVPRFVRGSGLPYPQPKWEPCCYYIDDVDGDSFEVARERYGRLYSGFEWVR